jgi:hypothetical protein
VGGFLGGGDKFMTKKHSRLAPSSAYRWLNCPASIEINELLNNKNDAESDASREGTKAHEYAEKILKQYKVKREVLDSIEDEVMRDSVEEYVTYVKSFWESVSTLVVGTEVEVEIPIKDSWGTVDAFSISDDEIHVFDFKYGFRKIEAKNNPQLILYGLGLVNLVRQNPMKQDVKIHDNTVVSFHIIQPRVSITPSKWSMTVKELDEWLINNQGNIDNAVNSENGEPIFSSGEHCSFCRARSVCKKRMNNYTDVKKFLGEKYSNGMLSVEEVEEYYADSLKYAKYVEELKKFLLRAGEEGTLKRYKLQDGKSRRMISSTELFNEVAKKAIDDGVYEEEDIYIMKQIKPITEIERNIGKKKFEEYFGQCLEKTPYGKELVKVIKPIEHFEN